MIRARLILALTLSLATARAEQPTAQPPQPAAIAAVPASPTPAPIGFIRPGEVIELRMSYGLLGTAGTTRIETLAERTPAGPHFRIRVATKSRGLVDTFYPVTNDSESVLDATTGRPITITTRGKNGRRLTEKTTTFDYEKGLAVHVNTIRPKYNATVPLPPAPAYDLMVAMLQARDWRLKPGESHQVLCVNDEEFFTIEVAAIGEEKVTTPAGAFQAVVLEPRPIGKPTSFFEKGGALKIWISKGDRPQILRIDTKTKFGTITAVLVKAETVAPLQDPPPSP